MISFKNWKDLVRSVLPWRTYWSFKRFREEWLVWIKGDSLNRLAKIYKTDKGNYHAYMDVYKHWLAPFRDEPVRLLEIGVGGYDKPKLGGDSLRMWKSYFRKGTITGIDIYDKSMLAESRIKIYQGNQSDAAFLRDVSAKEGPFTIIIDDGSHVQSDIIISFETLFPFLVSGGIYVIEDTQTSYWTKYGGSTAEMDSVDSAMNYFKDRIHGVNQKEWKKDELQETMPESLIATIAFYHNLIVVVKK